MSEARDTRSTGTWERDGCWYGCSPALRLRGVTTDLTP